jgi:hypothetical protein
MSSTSGDDALAKPFEVAIDIAKQLLTLSTAIITLTITFSKDFLGAATGFQKGLLSVAWLFFFVSVLGGVWLMYAANGSLADLTRRHSIYDSNTAIPMGIQQVCFVAGLALTGWFGALAL